jgi:hypothetical protein
MISLQVQRLHKKLRKIEKKYSALPEYAKVPRARYAKMYKNTVRRLEKLTGRKFI